MSIIYYKKQWVIKFIADGPICGFAYMVAGFPKWGTVMGG